MRTAGKPSDPDERRPIAQQAMENACSGMTHDAITGEKGKRGFGNFNQLMEQGGTLNVEATVPDVTKKVESNCKLLTDRFGAEIADGLADSKGMYGYKIKGNLQELAGTCGKKQRERETPIDEL